MKKTTTKKIIPIITVFVFFPLILLIVLYFFVLPPRSLNRSLLMTHEVNTRLLFNKSPKAACLDLLEACRRQQSYQTITFDYPFDKSIFPPEIVPPTFLWHDPNSNADLWLVGITFADNPNHIYVLTAGKRPEPFIDPRAISESNKHYKPGEYEQTARGWTPNKRIWNIVKSNSAEKSATVTVIGFDSRDISAPLSKAAIVLSTSKDPVAVPIFYRDVPLMPSTTKEGTIKPIAKDALPLITWKLRNISKDHARVVLSDMPTCANCHTFSVDGKTLGMDLDGPDGDKGAYAFTAVKKKITVTLDDIITWNSFEPKDPPGHKSFGLFSHVSPDGKYVITTVNESVFVTNYEDFKFLQSFYATRGIFAVYSKETAAMKTLPGADDPNFVHTNACWSPDGKFLVFSRASAKDNYEHEELPKYSGDPKETFIQYDLYRMPFNEGKGGVPEPVKGASNNGMSNSFARYSPDGKWIVFVKAQKGQLMRPDSELYIIPAEGGQARKLSCNLPLMNSWHSWSPNSRWLVFSSKGFSPFTQMFLTHIDENGNSSPAILVPNSTSANRAVNIPEFLNNKSNAIAAIKTPTQQAYRYAKIGDGFMSRGEYDEAVKEYEKSLELNPYLDKAYTNLGAIFAATGKTDEAITHYKKALEINDDDALTHCNLGLALIRKGKLDEAISQFAEAQKLDPSYADTYLGWATALNRLGKTLEALSYYRKSYDLHSDKDKVIKFMAPFLIDYAGLLQEQGETEQSLKYYREAVNLKKDDPGVQYNFATFLNKSGRPKDAIVHYRHAIKADPDFIEAVDNLVWLLATHPDAEIRNGTEAVKLAQHACQLTGYQDPFVLDCLAAAYAEIGRFDDAVTTAQKALKQAKGYGQPELERQLQNRMELFKDKKPYRQLQTGR